MKFAAASFAAIVLAACTGLATAHPAVVNGDTHLSARQDVPNHGYCQLRQAIPGGINRSTCAGACKGGACENGRGTGSCYKCTAGGLSCVPDEDCTPDGT